MSRYAMICFGYVMFYFLFFIVLTFLRETTWTMYGPCTYIFSSSYYYFVMWFSLHPPISPCSNVFFCVFM